IRFPFLRIWEKSVNAETKERLKYALPAPVRRAISFAYHTLTYRSASEEHMDPDLNVQLMQEFEPKVRALSDLIERDLTHWLEPKREAA
ncbi:MAG: hypothetical protein L6Q57_09090, partial [Alphaproteobacteria bacterium]|nr:hypothetical protein [Alphaproteobacteria bacterium]